MGRPTNSEIAAAFDELADLYELDGAIVHRVVAYRTAAKAVREATVSVAALAEENRATELPGIGATLQEKIQALAAEGEIPAAVRLRAQFPPGVVAMTRLEGLGAKRVRRLYEELGITDLDGLREAAEGERIRGLRGFGAKAEEAILVSLSAFTDDGPRPRFVLDAALRVAETVLAELRAHPAAEQVELAGSARRWADSVKDLDIIATAHDPAALAEHFAGLAMVERASGVGEAGAKVLTHSGLPVDLRIVAPDQFGNLLQHFTGSKEHNMALREMSVRRGLHISEYGVLDDASGETHRCATEAEVYALLGLEYIEPELREGRGELEAAARGELPELVEVEDLRGDVHAHTTLSDGRATLREMVAAARKRGHEYLAITDHSASHGFGNHVTPDALRARIEEVAELNAELGDEFTALAGTEVNVMPDGSLDYEDDLLARLDWVIASVHTAFRTDSATMTKRIVTAMEHPLVDAFGHLTGRKIETRAPYAIDIEAVLAAAARTGTMLEINGNPDRRDLNDTTARAAAAAGVPILVTSDAHWPARLGNVRYGVATARRAWLTKEQVANTRSWPDLAALRKRGR